MPTWGKNDNAANSVIWAPAQLKKEPDATNRDALFGNNTADAFTSGATVGQYGVDDNEVRAARAGAGPKSPHTGWILRTEGSGGRAGRVHNEVLVAMSGMIGDATDDAVLPDYGIVIQLQPADASGNSAADESVTFTVSAVTVPPGGSFVYEWQFTANTANPASWATADGEDGVTDANTTVLTVNTAAVNSVLIPDQTSFRLNLQVSGIANTLSDSAILTITS